VIGPESLRWVLTAAFVAASAFHLARVPRFPGADRLTEATHLAMGVAMVAMIWPWGRFVPPPVWVGVFTASTGFFVVRAWRSAGRRVTLGLFATSMAACAWMGQASSGPLDGMDMLAPPPSPVSWPALCHGLMSAGMGLALLTMV